MSQTSQEEQPRAGVFGFVSYKGGGGRTTLLMSVAQQLLLMGLNVLVIDLDFDAPGIPIFRRLPSPDGNEPDRLFEFDLTPDRLRRLGENEILSSGGRKAQVPIPGLLSAVVGALDDEKLANGQIGKLAHDVREVKVEVGEVLKRIKYYNLFPVFHELIKEKISKNIYEYVPEAAQDAGQPYPAVLYILPSGGMYVRREGGGQVFWDYERFSEGDKNYAETFVAQEMTWVGYNFLASVIEGAVDSIAQENGHRGVDVVLIDHRPGDDRVTSKMYHVSDGIVYVSTGACGALSGIVERISNHKKVYESEEINPNKDRVPQLISFILNKSCVESYSGGAGGTRNEGISNYIKTTWEGREVGELLKPGDSDDFISIQAADVFKNADDELLHIACHHLVGGLNTLPVFEWSRRAKAGDASDRKGVRGVVEQMWHSYCDCERPAVCLALELDTRMLPFMEATMDSWRWSQDIATGFRMGSGNEMGSLYTGANAVGLLALALRQHLHEAGRKIVYLNWEPRDPFLGDIKNIHDICYEKDVNIQVTFNPDMPNSLHSIIKDYYSGLKVYLWVRKCLTEHKPIGDEAIRELRRTIDWCSDALKSCERDEQEGTKEGGPLKHTGIMRSLCLLEANARMSYALALIEKKDRAVMPKLEIVRNFRKSLSLYRKAKGYLEASIRGDLRAHLAIHDVNSALHHIRGILSSLREKECDIWDATDDQKLSSEVIMLRRELERWINSVWIVDEEWIADWNDMEYWLSELDIGGMIFDLYSKLDGDLMVGEAIAKLAKYNLRPLTPASRASILAFKIHKLQKTMADALADQEKKEKLVEDLAFPLEELFHERDMLFDQLRRGNFQNRTDWLACGYLEMALYHVTKPQPATDLALDYCRRAATLFLYNALEEKQKYSWFLLAVARTMSRAILERRQKKRGQRNDKDMNARRIKIVRRDAFYAFEQWQALRDTGDAQNPNSDQEDKDEKSKDSTCDAKKIEKYVKKPLELEGYYDAEPALILDKCLTEALKYAVKSDELLQDTGADLLPYARERLRAILEWISEALQLQEDEGGEQVA